MAPSDAPLPEPPRRGALRRPSTGAWQDPVAAVPKLSVEQFRARWTWAERVAFEDAALASGEMRAISNELLARVVTGVNPRSATMAALGARVAAYGGIIDAARLAAITAPVGTYAGEPGASADAPPPVPQAAAPGAAPNAPA